jgi:hypothetical protein
MGTLGQSSKRSELQEIIQVQVYRPPQIIIGTPEGHLTSIMMGHTRDLSEAVSPTCNRIGTPEGYPTSITMGHTRDLGEAIIPTCNRMNDCNCINVMGEGVVLPASRNIL